MVDRVGQQLGNYRLTRLLGRGGFAEVYLGEHLRLTTQAAIKVLYMQIEDDAVEDFLNEARTVAHLAHPHIVRIFDFDVQEGLPFLVMEYAPNGTLRQRHPKGTRLPLPTIVDYVKQVADALQYAHDEKLVHRDIKPENMLLGKRNELLLSDFGIALVAQSSRLQSTKEIAGTVSYMAPEQLQGKPRLASDQYSLGVVVYEWLCGSRPFSGSFSELASQHIFTPPPPLREKLPELSPDVAEVVHTALAKDAQQRFANIRAFATALEQASRTASSRTVALTSELSTVSQTLFPLTGSTVSATPLGQLSQSLDGITPPNQASESSASTTRLPISDTRSLTTSEFIQPARYGLPKRRFSQRIALLFLAILLVISGSLAWLAFSHPLFGFAITPISTPIPNTPRATLPLALTTITTATSSLIPTATSRPTPSPTVAAALLPTPSPTVVVTPSPTATATSLPTATPVPTANSTIHLTQCGNNLVAPWVALYQYSNFGGQQICFSGTGLIDLANYGFANKTEAINIAASGVFLDSGGTKLSFYYGDEKSDLGTWDNRISSFRVDG